MPDIFISYKAAHPDGRYAENEDIATELYKRLTNERGFDVFMSKMSQKEYGVSSFTDEVDEIIEDTMVMVVVATDTEDLAKRWMRHEWSQFVYFRVDDDRPYKKLLTLSPGAACVDPHKFPSGLRRYTNIVLDDNWEDVVEHISNALANAKREKREYEKKREKADAPGKVEGAIAMPQKTRHNDSGSVPTSEDGLEFVCTDAGYVVAGIGSYGSTDLVIPQTHLGLPIVGVREGAFRGNANVSSVVISEGVTEIGAKAFYGCTSLTDVTIPGSVICVGTDAFSRCRHIKNLYVKDVVAWCGIQFGNARSNPMYYAEGFCLDGEQVKNLLIPQGVASVGSYAFFGCKSLESVTIPEGTVSIDNSAFANCDALSSVNLPRSLRALSTGVFTNCVSLTDVVLPERLCMIGHRAFSSCTSMKNIAIPDGVVDIGYFAFSDCSSLADVTLPKTLLSIGDRAFVGCESLEYINIPSVLSIGVMAFFGCKSLTEITIPESVVYTGSEVFFYCENLGRVVINANLDTVERDMFFACHSLKTVFIPSSVKDILGDAFCGCDSLEVINYEGDDSDWENINIEESGNEDLGNARIRYNVGKKSEKAG